ncbi:Dabb family protein [Aquiflexum sp. TKW24L]|uniref:Dabb family protein n=1 Tax=Aquiflexum sp. TKW24L TaxID=2942212 RepID=UPI0020BEFDEF|nr:Dabb family protein [Aquiflexum sp. TKW24L]MCL6260167.1 Dabb family protein [Aquiflexum sp. TKW24L]
MIRHTVVFKLKFPKSSSEEKEFLWAAAALALIPGVQNFESLRQISKKNDFDYGLSMEFDSEAEYKFYNNHADHAKFVEEYWVRCVEKFLEIDYELTK